MEIYEASRMIAPEIIDHIWPDYSTSRDMPTVIPQIIYQHLCSHIPMRTPILDEDPSQTMKKCSIPLTFLTNSTTPSRPLLRHIRSP